MCMRSNKTKSSKKVLGLYGVRYVTEDRSSTIGESVSEATVVNWLKKVGEVVLKDELLVELETDKVTLEVSSPTDGTLELISFEAGSAVKVGDILGAVKRRHCNKNTLQKEPSEQQLSEDKIEVQSPSVAAETKTRHQ